MRLPKDEAPAHAREPDTEGVSLVDRRCRRTTPPRRRSLWWLGDGIRCAKLGAVIVAGRETLEHFQKQFSS
jgi:hypothetical protein